MKAKHELWTPYTWNGERKGRERVMVITEKGCMDARRAYYLKYHPRAKLDGYAILHLDMNPYNFDKNNLVKVTIQERNLLLNTHLLSKDVKLNKLAIKTIRQKLKNIEIEEIINEKYGRY